VSKSRTKYRFVKWLAIVLVAMMALVLLFRWSIIIDPPALENHDETSLVRSEVDRGVYQVEESWFKKNSYGLWELYLEGSDIELGIKNGILTREQIHYQEDAFVDQLMEMVASENYLRFLKQVVIWMNRDLDDYIPIEYQREIYGVSLQASDTFSFIGPSYQRILNYHAAHDIGHAMQNLNLVACTAFGVNGSRSADGKLLVGRNFDFSMGEAFAKNKIIAFYKPDQGYKFASITWGGMIGVVSGMNDQGLVVTLNAAKSRIPTTAKTPVSILARKILQYASNIEEAYEIAEGYETFVAESFLVSSAHDNRTVVIEKSPDKMDLYDPGGETLILTNHFQGELFRDSKRTLKNRAEGASVYRWQRTDELLKKKDLHDVKSFIQILRDQNGLGDAPIGVGNEKAINQLIAHHSVVFMPGELKMWVSAYPYQLGAYICYDLNRVFADTTGVTDQIFSTELSIEEDPFLFSDAFKEYKEYRTETVILKEFADTKVVEGLEDEQLEAYIQKNPLYYYPYFVAGEIYRLKGNKQRAKELYNKSLSLEIPRLVDREQVEEAKEQLIK
jgi:isopenicillin-N N-acyltransferase-like protein